MVLRDARVRLHPRALGTKRTGPRQLGLSIAERTGLPTHFHRAVAPRSGHGGLLWNSVRAWARSNNFISVMASTRDPDLSLELIQAVIESYRQTLRARLEEKSATAAAFYLDKMQKTEEAMAKSRNELAKYLNARPDLGGSGGELSATRDPNLARLQSQAELDTAAFNAARAAYRQNQEMTEAGIEGQPLGFTVLDEPQRPMYAVGTPRFGLIKLPLVGTVLALVVSSGVAVFLILTNRSVLGPTDVQIGLGLPVLGEIPELRRKRFPWQRSARDAVRWRLGEPVHVPSTNAGAI